MQSREEGGSAPTAPGHPSREQERGAEPLPECDLRTPQFTGRGLTHLAALSLYLPALCISHLRSVCHSNHINAFPTIVTFKGDVHSHEHYHGDRTTDAFLRHIEFEIPAAGSRRRMEARGEMHETPR